MNGPLLWCLAAAALFGAATPAAKALLGALPPLALAGLLYLGAALAVAPGALRRRWRRPGRANALRLAGAVFFGGVVAPVLLLWGLRHAAASSVALWLTLETVATAVLGRLVFHEHAGGRTWAAVALLVAASVLLAAPQGFAAGPAAAWVAAACACWGLDNHLTALIDGFTPAQTTLVKGAVAGALNLALGLALEAPALHAGTVAGALGIGALGYGLSLALYIAGAQQLGATRAQMLFATAPLWGAAIAWTALGEAVQPVQPAAAVVMALALWLVHRERHAHAHAHAHAAVTHTHGHRHDDGHHEHPHAHPPALGWHVHEHTHGPVTHAHPHRPDLHHRHDHED